MNSMDMPMGSAYAYQKELHETWVDLKGNQEYFFSISKVGDSISKEEIEI